MWSPEIIGREVLFSRWKKSALAERFVNSLGEQYEHVTFHISGGPAVVIFPVTEDGLVIAVREFRYAAKKAMLCLPGGLPEADESLRDCAARELTEETGYSSSRIEPLVPAPIYFDPASVDFCFSPILAWNCQGRSEQKLDAAEHIEIVPMTVKEWFALVARGEIVDSKSIVASHLASLILDRSP